MRNPMTLIWFISLTIELILLIISAILTGQFNEAVAFWAIFCEIGLATSEILQKIDDIVKKK